MRHVPLADISLKDNDLQDAASGASSASLYRVHGKPCVTLFSLFTLIPLYSYGKSRSQCSQAGFQSSGSRLVQPAQKRVLR